MQRLSRQRSLSQGCNTYEPSKGWKDKYERINEFLDQEHVYITEPGNHFKPIKPVPKRTSISKMYLEHSDCKSEPIKAEESFFKLDISGSKLFKKLKTRTSVSTFDGTITEIETTEKKEDSQSHKFLQFHYRQTL